MTVTARIEVAAVASHPAAYKQTPVFDESGIPAGLLRRHSTKPGVWALIHVLEGRLLYRVLKPPKEQELSPGTAGVVHPEQLHEVAPLGPVRFFIEFFSSAPPVGSPHADADIVP